jgi:DNA recombination-dependent growth factor C
MGLYTGSASYVRYRLVEDPPERIKEFALEKLKQFSFREIEAGTLNEKSSGWVSAENMASTFFDDLHFSKEPYLAFSLRIDVRRVPGLAMKAAMLREEIKYKKSTGLEVIRKKDKDVLKDQVRQDLVRKSLPVPTLFDVCWNTMTGEVLFFSTSAAANEEFAVWFLRTFALKLARLLPYDLAGAAAEKNPGVEIRFPTVSFTDE